MANRVGVLRKGLGSLGSYAALAVLLLASGCGEQHAPQPTAALESLPVPAHLDEVDPPVRAQYQSLRQALDRALAGDGAAALSEAYGNLGMWHQAYGDHQLARLAYLHALAAEPDRASWLYYLGLVHGTLGETEAARRRLGRFLELETENATARVHLAEIELEAGHQSEAKRLLQAALATQPTNARALTDLGRLELQERNYSAALSHLERALELQPEAEKIHYSLGLAYRGLGDRQRAAAFMAKGSVDNRDKTDASMQDALMDQVYALKQGSRAHGKRGRRAFVEGDFARAIEEARNAVVANPEAPQPRLNLGAALLRADRAEEAVPELEEALRLSPGHPIVHFNLGATFYKLGRRGEAERQYRSAVTANPGFKEARFNLANLLRFAGDFAAAGEQYEAVVALDPGLALARVWRAVCLVETGREALARQTLEKDLSELRGNPQLSLLYARLLAAAGDPAVRDGDRALSLAEAIYRARPQLGGAEALAAAHAERGSFDQAIAWQEASLDAAREQASGKVLRRLSQRLALYRQHKPCRQVWDVDELSQAHIQVSPPMHSADQGKASS